MDDPQDSAMLEGLAEPDAAPSAGEPEGAVFEKLEQRILTMVEQLRESRRRQVAIEKQVAKLKEELAEREEEVRKLRSERASKDTDRKTVQSRIESLLDRIDSMEA